MRMVGTRAYGVRLPIISRGDDLVEIAADCLARTIVSENLTLCVNDVVGVTEAIVAKSQGNYARVDDIAADVIAKFGAGADIGVVFPGLSRNRYLHILKGVARGAGSLTILLRYPSDEVGNPIMDMDVYDGVADNCADPVAAGAFKELAGSFVHPFTGVDYISLYESIGDNVKVFLSKDPRDILKFTKNIIVGEIHSRFSTKNRLLKAGAQKTCLLSDILSEPVNGSGYNEDYGVLGSNVLSENDIKLFPRDCGTFIGKLRAEIERRLGTAPEALIYGDGAFKDPAAGIWELMDPVVSPAFTERLGGIPDELKLKYLADNVPGDLSGEEKRKAVVDMIKDKKHENLFLRLGTTPRRYADLIGSLCDLLSGSGDKGTPVVLIKGYFDDYSEN